MKTYSKSIFFAILAAALYAINAPFSKVLLEKISPTMMASFLYFGAGIGMLLVNVFQKRFYKESNEEKLSKSDFPYIFGMIALDIAAPIFLMIGLSMTSAANASLLNNFEIVSTSVIALCIFKEKISSRLWIAIILVTLASIILSLEGESFEGFEFSYGSLFVLLACVCWGFENNCTRKLSNKNPIEIVIIKGLCCGLGSLIIAMVIGEKFSEFGYIIAALLLGFVAYGLSIFFYIKAQRTLGAAKTSAYYAVSPFIGTAMSLIIFPELPSVSFIVASLIMIAGTYFASIDTNANA